MKDDFSSKVHQQIERLKKQSLDAIEREVAEKRIAWYQQNHPRIEDRNLHTPRKAYELLFFDYMDLFPGDVPVIYESETEIVWLSHNNCPTLEACTALGLDTRQVCRAAYEKSTQALVSQLDPQLRFLRSYEDIRPHAEHCKERIVLVDFAGMMAIAIEEAKISRQEGNMGYGAVVALGNQIIGKAHDTVMTETNPGLHAEVNAIRQAVHSMSDTNLCGAVLFTTCEPCPMCLSLAVRANLTTIVYGMSIQETVRAEERLEKAPVLLEVIGGILKDECKLLYS